MANEQKQKNTQNQQESLQNESSPLYNQGQTIQRGQTRPPQALGAELAPPVIEDQAPMGAPLNHPRAVRPHRVPIGSRSRLGVPEKKGYVRRWVVDRGDRIQQFREAGWEIVQDPYLRAGQEPSKSSSLLTSTARKDLGHGDYGYLMEIPEKWYREDQLAKVERNKAHLQRIQQPKRDEGQYGYVKSEFSEFGQNN